MENIKRKLERYETLFRQYGPIASRCTISELALLLNISERHVQTVVKKCVSSNWLTWQSQPGRSKKATLYCHLEPIEACYKSVSLLVDQGNTEQVLNILSFGGRNASIELKKYLLSSHKVVAQSVSMPFHRKISSLIPTLAICRTERFLVSQVFQRLVKVEEDKVEADLAHHWQQNKTATRWEFVIRGAVICHDGSRISNTDIVSCLKKLISHPYWSALYCNIKEISCTGEDRVNITLFNSDHHLPRLLARSEASIYPQTLSASNIVGSGPFSVEVYSDRMLRLARFDQYILTLPLLQRVDLWIDEQWAKDKACAQNKLSLTITGKNAVYTSAYKSSFLVIRDQNSQFFDDIATSLSYENNNECKALAQIHFPSIFSKQSHVVNYGQYQQQSPISLCSVIQENDSLYSHLAFLQLYPFKKILKTVAQKESFTTQIDKIKASSTLIKAIKALDRLYQQLKQSGIVEILKTESFELTTPENLKGVSVNGFGWCDFSTLWIDRS